MMCSALWWTQWEKLHGERGNRGWCATSIVPGAWEIWWCFAVWCLRCLKIIYWFLVWTMSLCVIFNSWDPQRHGMSATSCAFLDRWMRRCSGIVPELMVGQWMLLGCRWLYERYEDIQELDKYHFSLSIFIISACKLIINCTLCKYCLCVKCVNHFFLSYLFS